MDCWYKDHDKDKNPIANYFADKQQAEFLIKRIKMKIIKKCYYCKKCKDCEQLSNLKKIFNKQGFWTFNKYVRTWNIFDPEWSYKNTEFELYPLRQTKPLV